MHPSGVPLPRYVDAVSLRDQPVHHYILHVQVKHLVLVETDEEYNARMMLKRAKETTVQPPVHVRHDSMSHIHVESQDKL